MTNLIDDMLSGAGGDDAGQQRRRDLGGLLGKAVSGASGPASSPTVVDLEPLATLTQTQWKVVLRYLPSDLVVPILGGAPLAVATRLVEAFDAEGQAWIASQGSAIERVEAVGHAKAAAALLALVRRLADEGRLPAVPAAPSASAASPAPPKAEAVAPNAMGLGLSVAVRQADAGASVQPVVPAVRPPVPAASVEDGLIGTIAALVDGARGQDPETLRRLAGTIDHPVIATGLGLLASGCDAHALREALHQVEADYLSEQERHLAVIRAGLLSIRFGDDAEAFRRRLG